MTGDAASTTATTRAEHLLIFDCDGVLVQTEPGETMAILDVARSYGFRATVDQALASFRGLRLANVQALIEQAIGATLPDCFVSEVRAACAATVDASTRASPGLRAALRALARRGPALATCVASSSPASVIEARLSAAGLIDHFRGRLYSAYDVQSWKPDPGLFLHAASTSGLPAERCIVVEDSVVGVAAGLAAGMAVVAYEPTPTALSGRPGVHRLRHMRELDALVASITHATAPRQPVS